MARTRIKICGITNVADALVAANAGADAIGLVFYPKSVRHVSIEQATEIVASLPAFVTSVALFVNPEKALVESVIANTQVDLLQFHGDEPEDFCQQFNRPYIKAIRIQSDTSLLEVMSGYPSAQAVLFDTYVKGIPGGTGESFNWQWLNEQATSELNIPIVLAGGLVADNVQEAINIIHPWAVDVSGGVEASEGVKSATKIQNFIANSMSC